MNRKKANNTEILFGVHPVWEALIAGRRRFHRICRQSVRTAGRLADLTAMAEKRKIPITTSTGGELDTMAQGGVHQGIAAVVDPLPLAGPADLIRNMDAGGRDGFIVAVDGIQDPHNLGAIVRTALCAGAAGILVPKNRSAGPTPVVSKISAGALEHLPVVRVTNLVRSLRLMKEEGFWIYGMDGSATHSLFDADLGGRFVLVIGGEEKGLHRLVAETCDRLMKIPQVGPVASLNASVAASIAIFEARRQMIMRADP